MHRSTVLKQNSCDLKRLPLGAIEAFLLSQVDGRMSLEELAEIVGLDLAETGRLARQLIELGAAAIVESPASQNKKKPVADEVRPSRPDPRAEVAVRPSLRPKPAMPPPKKTPTRKSLKMQKVAEPCELDEAMQATIAALDARLGTIDHYSILEVERGAEKKAIKRAYFALAAKFHPDRFFGKKLGAARAPLERIFTRITLAHDVLTNTAEREKYDATLSPPPKRKSSRAVRLSTRSMKAVKARTERPPKSKTVAPPPKPKTVAPPPKPKTVAPPPPSNDERLKQLHAAAKEIKTQQRVDMLLQAADDALRKDDPIGAANNYRLALEHRDDPYIRGLLDEVDSKAKSLRFSRSVTQARAADREGRWADAATHYARAHEARPNAEMAERAANALRLSSGDLDRAAELGEQAVALEPKNAGYFVTLGEVYLAAGKVARATDQSMTALELDPDDTRAKDLAAAIKKRKK